MSLLLPILVSFLYLTAAAPAPNSLATRTLTITRNDLLNGPCKPITIIFARGTLELGNVGEFAGPPFFDALRTVINTSNFAVQGVDYSATIPGYLIGGDPAGSATVITLANLASTKCPETQMVLSGYSQGAQLIHNALTGTHLPSKSSLITSTTFSKISALVLFGDPDRDKDEDGALPAAIDPADIKIYCDPSDLICDDLPIVMPSHLAYADDAMAAADFVADKVII